MAPCLRVKHAYAQNMQSNKNPKQKVVTTRKRLATFSMKGNDSMLSETSYTVPDEPITSSNHSHHKMNSVS